ncbi:MAG: ABC transporter permease [Clostridia bacterium]|nr:ABC transporter permease [Clostridia bacterium]
MKNRIWSLIQNFFPVIALAVILVVFTFLSGGKIWTAKNLQSVLNTMIPYCIGGAGLLFASAQGSSNMSVGSTLAFSAAVGAWVSNQVGFWAFVPTCLIVGLLCGCFIGWFITTFKVSSLMVTLAMLIALRALVTLITNGSSIFVDFAVMQFNNLEIKLPIFLVLMVGFWYLFEHTKLGYFSRCIGENEVVGKFSGIPVNKYKVIAYALAGLMAGVVAVFNVANICGASATMGNFFEMTCMIAMYVGGVPIRGGSKSRFYKLIIGAVTLAFLSNGLTISRVNSAYSELIQGVILLSVVFMSNFIQKQVTRYQMAAAAKASVA